MKSNSEQNSGTTDTSTHSRRKYAKHRSILASLLWLILIAVSVVVLRAVPPASARNLLPTAVYLNMTLLPLILTAGARETASWPAAVLLAAVSTPLITAGSGLAGGGDILLLTALPAAAGYASFGRLTRRMQVRRRVPLTIVAGVVLLAPVTMYFFDPASSALVALPGAGPMGLTAMLLGRPPQWAPFGPAWISTGVYAATGMLSAPIAAVWSRIRTNGRPAPS